MLTRTVLALAALLLAVACGGDGGNSGSPQPRGTLTEAELRQIQEAASTEQWVLFADGTLSFAEYEQATLDYAACLTAAGATVGELELQGGRFLYVPYSYPGPGGLQDNPTGQKVLACYLGHQLVEDVWAYLNPPTQRELDEAREMLIACLREVGYPLPDDPQPADLEQAAVPPAGVAGICFSQVRREFGPLNSGY